MNKRIMITGANAGLGKESARQFAMMKETEKIYLACRNEDRAILAKDSLENSTGRSIFEIVIMDVSSIESVKSAVKALNEPIDALVMNAGGMGGKNPGRLTSNGVTEIFAHNVLGHTVLLEELLKAKKLNNVALYAGSEAARGVKSMGMEQPKLKNASVEEFVSVYNGDFFGEKLDPMQAYGYMKYSASLWMSHLARKYPDVRFISMSPGSTSGTTVMNDMPAMMRFMFKYIMMPIVMPLRGMAHKLETGAKRFVDGVTDESLKSGAFYASRANKMVGPVIDQSIINPDFNNEVYQDNASEAIHRIVNQAS